MIHKNPAMNQNKAKQAYMKKNEVRTTGKAKRKKHQKSRQASKIVNWQLKRETVQHIVKQEEQAAV